MATPSMSRHHAEWLSLLDVSGPFLSLPVLSDVFPQGIDKDQDERDVAALVREAYAEWQASQSGRDEVAIHGAWVRLVLGDVLEWDERVLVEGQALPTGVTTDVAARYGEPTLRPTLALVDPEDRVGDRVRLLVDVWPAAQGLDDPVAGRPWKASPSDRMVELLHATGVRLGLVTNGERWLLVNAPVGETTGLISWYANLWVEERLTLRAFRALLGMGRFFGVADSATPEALLDRSATEQAEVTTQLGGQVRQAVELLVAAIDREDRERGRELLEGVEDAEVYEAAITVMMRLVFLLFAEEQRPPLFGDNELYDQHYAVSSMLGQLQGDADRLTEDVLERQHDAWSRLLATFRVVFAGSQHPDMRTVAYGGSLFDPDRFPFLEGRTTGTSWRSDPSRPLPISNRTVLHMLEAIQLLEMKGQNKGGGSERRRLSFRALDVEQIGHVYESLLEHTARRTDGIVLGMAGSKEPEIGLADLEAWASAGETTLGTELKALTGRSDTALTKDLVKPLDAGGERALREACDNDDVLFTRVRPFAALIRPDRAGRPVVIRDGGLYVTAGMDRRTSGAHYTPRSLTEPIVQYTMEPLVYVGPAEGAPPVEWRLRPWPALLELTVCDPAIGSGAFLVQTCRYLAERLVEAWTEEERETGKQVHVTRAGKRGSAETGDQSLPRDETERMAMARRLVADHCLYGVDKNPLAVEMAKLSMWLITLQRDRAFTFLDHRFKRGDSLLGVNREQLEHWSLRPGKEWKQLWLREGLRGAIDRAGRLRVQIANSPVRNLRDAEQNRTLHEQAEDAMQVAKLGGDLLIGAVLAKDPKHREQRRVTAGAEFLVIAEVGRDRVVGVFTDSHAVETREAIAPLREKAEQWLDGYTSFHWALEFPEVLSGEATPDGLPGFSGIVGNPPFMGGQKLTGAFGTPYRDYLVDVIAAGKKGSADLSAYFLLRAGALLHPDGGMGMLATNTIAQGDTREVGLDQLVTDGFAISRAVPSRTWPGTAALEVAHLWIRRKRWGGDAYLDEQRVSRITTYLTPPGRAAGTPYRLAANRSKSFQGSIVLGKGFILAPEEAQALIAKNSRNRDVLFPYFNGEDLNTRSDQSPSRWIINFFDWPIERAMEYPDCFRIVEEKVKPERENNNRKARRERWWQYAERADGLYRTIAPLERVIVFPLVTKYLNSVWQSNTMRPVFSHATAVVAVSESEWMGLFNSSLFDVWAREQASTMGATLRFTPSDCLETIPLPFGESVQEPEIRREIERVERSKLEICRRNDIGLTHVGNKVADANDSALEIRQLRERLCELDLAVLVAYGWEDLDLEHGFHETKQGTRFTVSERARREVLDRLLELNHQRHAAEVTQGLHEKGAKSSNGRRTNAVQPQLSFD